MFLSCLPTQFEKKKNLILVFWVWFDQIKYKIRVENERKFCWKWSRKIQNIWSSTVYTLIWMMPRWIAKIKKFFVLFYTLFFAHIPTSTSCCKLYFFRILELSVPGQLNRRPWRLQQPNYYRKQVTQQLIKTFYFD